MPVNPRSLENLLNMQRLESGETSEVHRVRASAEVQAWFRAMTAEERGELLARVAVGASIRDLHREEQHLQRSQPDVLEGLTSLQVVSTTLPARLKNELRWPPQNYINLEAVLEQTQELCLNRSNGKTV